MRIERATHALLPAIVDLSNHYAATTAANFAVEPETLESWQQSFDSTHDTHPWLAALDDVGELIGFAKASPWKGRCAYDFAAEVTVYVDPGQHRRGIGRELYNTLFPLMDGLGYRSLIGGITLPNDASVRLHEAMGMRRVALFEEDRLEVRPVA